MPSLTLKTRRRCEFVEITSDVAAIVERAGMIEGLCFIYCPHTTAGIAINENADPDVQRDVLATLERLFPQRGDYRHAEGNSDSHLKAILTGTSQQCIVREGRLLLGRWQGIFFAEFDGPRTRSVEILLQTATGALAT